MSPLLPTPRHARPNNGRSLATLALAGLLAMPLTAACGAGTTGPGEPAHDDPELLASSLSRELNPQVPPADARELSAANRDFGLELYHELAAEAAGDNLFLSPHSISIALAMTYAGARGETAAEMAQTFNFTLPDERLHAAFNALDLELSRRGQGAPPEDGGDPFTLNVVNAAWAQQGYPFLDSYLDLLAVNYGAGVRLLDFASEPEPSRLRINAWVEDQTRDRIKDLLPQGSIDANTTLVLTNAIYFKAGWANEFHPDATRDADFHRLDGTTTTVPLMRQSAGFRYAALDGARAIELPYVGDDVAMVVILPDAGRFEAFEAALDGDALAGVLDALHPEHGTIALPRFGFESSFALNDPLQALGMKKAFGGDADLSGIDGSRALQIAAVLHKSFVAVDEEGTEAAAATAVIVGRTSEPVDTFEMVVDRPFIFLIHDRPTGAVLFLGRVLDPS